MTDEKSSADARGRRLKSLRKMTDLSRRAMSEKHGIPAGTLKDWELGRQSGLTEKGAKRAITALAAEGIHCDIDWLLYGIGSAPVVSDKLYNPSAPLRVEQSSEPYRDEKTSVVMELRFFRQQHDNATDFLVVDDGMGPHYKVDDYVAGIKRFGDDIGLVIGCDAIVQTKEGDVLFRYLRSGREPGFYTLACLNPHAAVEQPIIYDIQLVSAAPVIWHRRPDPD